MFSFFFIFLAGIFDALFTVVKDNVNSRLSVFCQRKQGKWIGWYNGGNNAKWNPSYPSLPPIWWCSDAYHTFKYYWILCWAMAVLFASYEGVAWYWYLSAHAIQGFTFIYFYHYFLPIKSEGSFFDYLKRLIMFWKNAHAK